MNYSLFMGILMCAIVGSAIASQTIQYIKEHFKWKNCFLFGIVSFIIGFLCAFTFGSFSWQFSLWCGFLSVIGADSIYKSLEGKLGYTSYSKIKDK